MRVLVILTVLPLVGSLIGYTTKWLAVKMLFSPSEYRSIGPIGWQGVIQRRAAKFAAGVADTVSVGLDLDDILARVDGTGVASALKPALDAIAPEVTQALVEHQRPGAWEGLTDLQRSRAVAVVTRSLGQGAVELIDELAPQLGGLVDIDVLIVELLSGENADRLARLFQEIAADEVKWMIRFGAYCGFGIGVVEAAAFLFFDRWWLLPLVGALDGLINNWLAILMIFRPTEPKCYLGLFTYQGLFPARQGVIAENYARMLGNEVLTPANLSAHIGANPAAQGQLMMTALPILQAKLSDILSELSLTCGTERREVDTGELFGILLPSVGPASSTRRSSSPPSRGLVSPSP